MQIILITILRYKIGYSGGFSDICGDEGFTGDQWCHFEKCYEEHDYYVPCDCSYHYLIMMYLLVNMILSKNETGISMLKIFGFTDKEIRGMYIRANTIVVILLILITLPFQTMLMVSIWPACISTIPGFLDFVMQPEDFVIIIVTGIICYMVSSLCSMYKIRKVSMTVMLKNRDI